MPIFPRAAFRRSHVNAEIETNKKPRVGEDIAEVRERIDCFKPEFLKLSELEQKRILRKFAVPVEFIGDRISFVNSFLEEKIGKFFYEHKKKLTPEEETWLSAQLRKIDRSSQKVIFEMQKIFVPNKGRKEFSTFSTPYPLSKIHELLLSKSAKMKSLRKAVEEAKEAGLLSPAFKIPWDLRK